MEVLRFARALVPLAAIALLGPTGVARPPVLETADPPWDPPACRAAVAARPPSGGVAWFRMDAVLDAAGTLTGQRLTLGVVGGRARLLALPPESFASGPVEGVVLVGDDDGSRSRMRAIDPAGGCASTIAVEASVIRSAVLDTDLGATFEHRVDRATRADLGVWRRATRGGTAVRLLPGLAPDARHGRTFSTDLRWASDGRLAVASCGEVACRTRIVDTATGRVVRRAAPDRSSASRSRAYPTLSPPCAPYPSYHIDRRARPIPPTPRARRPGTLDSTPTPNTPPPNHTPTPPHTPCTLEPPRSLRDPPSPTPVPRDPPPRTTPPPPHPLGPRGAGRRSGGPSPHAQVRANRPADTVLERRAEVRVEDGARVTNASHRDGRRAAAGRIDRAHAGP